MFRNPFKTRSRSVRLVIALFLTYALYNILHKRSNDDNAMKQLARVYVQPHHQEKDTFAELKPLPVPDKEVFSDEKSQSCSPKQHVYFLKMAHSGSTTTTNLLYTYGMTHGLTFMTYGRSYPLKLDDARYMREPDPSIPEFKGKYDMLVQHTHYVESNELVIAEDMPEDTVKISIIRDPVSHLRSLMRNQPELEGIDDPVAYLLERREAMPKNKFGMLPSYYGLEGKSIAQCIDKIRHDFELVMVFEMFDESLVMLKRKLCWTIKDIVYVPLRLRSYDKRGHVNETIKMHFNAYNTFHYKLYDAMVEKLKRQISVLGPDFQKEVEHFQGVVKKVKEFCDSICLILKMIDTDEDTDILHAIHEEMTVEKSEWGPEFKYYGYDCAIKMLDPMSFDSAAHQRQNPEVCTSQTCYEWPFDYLSHLAKRKKFLYTC